MKTIAELRKLQEAELLEELTIKKEELRTLKASHKVTPLDNPMRIRKTRKSIAQIQTLLTEHTTAQEEQSEQK